MDIVIKKLDPSMADDYFFFFDQIAFADNPEWGCECYCCFFHATSQEAWRDVTAAQNKTAALELIQNGRLQGLLAYSSGKPPPPPPPPGSVVSL